MLPSQSRTSSESLGSESESSESSSRSSSPRPTTSQLCSLRGARLYSRSKVVLESQSSQEEDEDDPEYTVSKSTIKRLHEQFSLSTLKSITNAVYEARANAS